MEIKYTTFELDPKIFEKNGVNALIDPNGTFIYDNIYDVRTYHPTSVLPAGLFLRFGANIATRKIIFDMLSELEISKELEKRPLKKLSTSEQAKILLIKLCTSNVKNIILEGLDTFFNYKDTIMIIKSLKNHLAATDKTVIVTMNKVDNAIVIADRFLIVRDGKIVYNGKDYTKIENTDIKRFTELANAKGAKIKDYKDASDLLKAIYRSVK